MAETGSASVVRQGRGERGRACGGDVTAHAPMDDDLAAALRAALSQLPATDDAPPARLTASSWLADLTAAPVQDSAPPLDEPGPVVGDGWEAALGGSPTTAAVEPSAAAYGPIGAPAAANPARVRTWAEDDVLPHRRRKHKLSLRRH